MPYGLVKVIAGPLFKVYCRAAVTGLEHLPATGPVLLASNHLGTIDPLILPALLPRRVTFVAKSEYFAEGRITGKLLRAFGQLPVERRAGAAATEALETALDVLRAGEVFGIYPEGTRSPDGRLYRGRVGVGWLALASGAPVIPVGMLGTDRVMPRGASFPRPAKVRIRLGAPMTVSGSEKSARDRRLATDAIMAAIGELTGQERAGEYAPLPA
ncbi:1-acyl-sn-glycerol-3-phosphate acyltransferase [Longispora fulva]|uniref:1-acyl-sn-glycerol-3-phosphate acyltransferase n=1 Tax=Longispora fulva TaxID=619741 RepID=A0A8J7GV57_9ACTN|nr:lysophospholipid acyltransferase family protein [Longispora fulva]MBG6138808.1 1-acyl-sn-glycerol-3-phosphate acyltransferase [Longispora fulva]GIG58303.1 1-acyl-sn-glycerol-3-phosphate acyltransferase [Longispora fulva]